MFRRPAAALLGIALLLAACGGGSDDEGGRIDLERDSTTVTGPATTTGSTSEEPDGTDGQTSSMPQVTGDDEDAYVEALSLNLQLDPDNAALGPRADCIAPRWVEELGIDRFRRAGITPQELVQQTSMSAVIEIGPDLAESRRLIDVLPECEVDLLGSIFDTPAFADAPEAIRACLTDGLTEDMILDSMTAALAGDGVDAESEALRQPLEDLVRSCAPELGGTGP